MSALLNFELCGGKTNRLSGIHDAVRLSDADAEDAQKDIPQIESKLFADMREDVRPPVGFVDAGVVGIYPQGALLVCVRGAHADGDREDSNVHHDEQAELHGRVDVGEVKG